MGRKAPPPGYLARLRAVLGTRLGHVLLRAGGLALLVLVGGLVMRQARGQAYRMPEHRITRATLALEGLPSWADETIKTELMRDRFYDDLSVSVFDSDAEARVRGVVTRHPMVRAVRSVRIVFPNRAVVEPALRVPVAVTWVRVRDTRGRERRVHRLLADDGSLLPFAPYKGALERRRFALPEVTGIRAVGTADFGVIWEDRYDQAAEAVHAAGVAERIFRDLRGRVVVERVDVSRFPGSGNHVDAEVRFRAVVRRIRPGQGDRRIWIEWGRTERDCGDNPDEDCYRTKLARLAKVIGSGQIPATVHVRYPISE